MKRDKMSTKIMIPIIIAISVVVTAGITYSIDFKQDQSVSQVSEPGIIYVEKSATQYFEGTNDIKKIDSSKELKNILDESALFSGNFYDDRMLRTSMAVEEAVMFDSAESSDSSSPSVAPMPSNTASKAESGGSDYSTTNVQVENVDEPDYLKNDSKYVYIVSQNTLSIIDAYPADSAKLILKIALDVKSQYIQNMFLNDDRLVIFYNGQSDEEIIPQYEFIPRRSYSSVTHALIVDVSDKEKSNNSQRLLH